MYCSVLTVSLGEPQRNRGKFLLLVGHSWSVGNSEAWNPATHRGWRLGCVQRLLPQQVTWPAAVWRTIFWCQHYNVLLSSDNRKILWCRLPLCSWQKAKLKVWYRLLHLASLKALRRELWGGHKELSLPAAAGTLLQRQQVRARGFESDTGKLSLLDPVWKCSGPDAGSLAQGRSRRSAAGEDPAHGRGGCGGVFLG